MKKLTSSILVFFVCLLMLCSCKNNNTVTANIDLSSTQNTISYSVSFSGNTSSSDKYKLALLVNNEEVTFIENSYSVVKGTFDNLEWNTDYETIVYISKNGFYDSALASKRISTEEKVEEKIFEGITFADKKVSYNGEVQKLQVEGLPNGANVEYQNNSNKNVGVYSVKAIITKEGYKSLELTASLEIVAIEFSNTMVMNDVTVDYDGKVHSITVENLPVGASVAYTGNDKVSCGKYEVTAIVSMEGHITKELTAFLTINGQELSSDIMFDDDIFLYDGQNHSLNLLNVPENANVTYEYNSQVLPGTYTVKAYISVEGYNEKIVSGTLIIEALKFNVEFEDTHVEYTGEAQSLVVKGAPEGTQIIYINNEQTEIGKYTVKADLQCVGYDDIRVEAYLYIDKIKPTLTLSQKEETITYGQTVDPLDVMDYLSCDKNIYINMENIVFGYYASLSDGSADDSTDYTSIDGKVGIWYLVFNTVSDETHEMSNDCLYKIIINRATGVIDIADEVTYQAMSGFHYFGSEKEDNKYTYSKDLKNADPGEYELVITLPEDETHTSATKTIKVIIVAPTHATDLFFSEYHMFEGTDKSNKYVCIYNGTGSDVSLEGYMLVNGANGTKVESSTGKLDLGQKIGGLAAGKTLVIGLAATMKYIENNDNFVYFQQQTVAGFNGDDCLALIKNDTIIDIIGVNGVRPSAGFAFGNMTTALAEGVLRRQAFVFHPTANLVENKVSWDANEWEYVKNEFGMFKMDLTNANYITPIVGLDKIEFGENENPNLANSYVVYTAYTPELKFYKLENEEYIALDSEPTEAGEFYIGYSEFTTKINGNDIKFAAQYVKFARALKQEVTVLLDDSKNLTIDFDGNSHSLVLTQKAGSGFSATLNGETKSSVDGETVYSFVNAGTYVITISALETEFYFAYSAEITVVINKVDFEYNTYYLSADEYKEYSQALENGSYTIKFTASKMFSVSYGTNELDSVLVDGVYIAIIENVSETTGYQIDAKDLDNYNNCPSITIEILPAGEAPSEERTISFMDKRYSQADADDISLSNSDITSIALLSVATAGNHNGIGIGTGKKVGSIKIIFAENVKAITVVVGPWTNSGNEDGDAVATNCKVTCGAATKTVSSFKEVTTITLDITNADSNEVLIESLSGGFRLFLEYITYTI